MLGRRSIKHSRRSWINARINRIVMMWLRCSRRLITKEPEN